MAPERSSANWATRWMADIKIFRPDDDEFVVVARQDGFVVGELAGELARGEDAAADTEEEGLLVVGELDGFDLGGVEEREQLAEGLARDEGFLFAGDAGEGFAELFDVGEAVTVGGDHGHGFGLEHQQGAVEGVAGFFVGDGEDGFGDHALEGGRGDLEGAGGGEFGDGGEVGAGHADHFGVGTAGADLHPVVVHQLDGDVAFGEELDVVEELAGGDGAGAGLFDLGGAGGADGLVEVGGGDGELVVGRFEEEVGEDGDGGFTLDHGLRRRQFAEKLDAGDGDFEVAGGRGGGGHCGLLSDRCCILGGGDGCHGGISDDGCEVCAGETLHRMRCKRNIPAVA